MKQSKSDRRSGQRSIYPSNLANWKRKKMPAAPCKHKSPLCNSIPTSSLRSMGLFLTAIIDSTLDKDASPKALSGLHLQVVDFEGRESLAWGIFFSWSIHLTRWPKKSCWFPYPQEHNDTSNVSSHLLNALIWKISRQEFSFYIKTQLWTQTDPVKGILSFLSLWVMREGGLIPLKKAEDRGKREWARLSPERFSRFSTINIQFFCLLSPRLAMSSDGKAWECFVSGERQLCWHLFLAR